MRKYLLGVLVGVLPVLLFGQNRKLVANLGLVEGAYHLEMRPDGRRVAASGNNYIKEWDSSTGLQTLCYLPGEPYIHDLKYRNDGTLIAVTRDDHTLFIRNVITEENLFTYRFPDEEKLESRSYTIDQEGKYLAIPKADGTIIVVETITGKTIYSLNAFPSGPISSELKFSKNGKYLATNGRTKEESIKIWEVSTGKMLHTIPHRNGFYYDKFSFSPTGNTIVVFSPKDEAIDLWDLATGKLIRKLAYEDDVEGASFTNDGRSIALWNDYFIRFINAETGKVRIDPGWHTDEINNIAFSPDSKRVITSSFDKTAKIWDAEKGTLLHTLKAHEEYLKTAIFSPSGKYIATGDSKGKINIWREKNYKLTNTLTIPNSQALTLAYSHNDQYIAAGTNNSEVIIWDVKTGQKLYNLKEHTKSIRKVLFNKGGDYLAVLDDAGLITIWNLNTGKIIQKMDGKGKYKNIDFLSETDLVVLLHEGGQIQVWDIISGQIKNKINTQSGWAAHESTIQAEHRLYALVADNYIEIRDLQTGASLKSFELWDVPEQVKISPDGKKLISFNEYNSIRLWDIETGNSTGQFGFHLYGQIEFLKFNPTTQSFIIGTQEANTIEVIEYPAMKKIYSIPSILDDNIFTLQFSPNGEELAVGEMIVKTIKVWEVSTMKLKRELPGHVGGANIIAYGPDGNLLASWGEFDQNLIIWNLNSGQIERKIPKQIHKVNFLEFSPEGRWLVTSTNRDEIKIWEVSTGKLVREYEGKSACFSHDGTRLAFSNRKAIVVHETASWKRIQEIQDATSKYDLKKIAFINKDENVVGYDGNQLKIWNITTGVLIRRFDDKFGRITDFDFSPDGKSFVTAVNNSLNLYDFETGNLTYTFSGQLDIAVVCFNPGGTLIASGGRDKQVKLWDVNNKCELVTAITFEQGNGWAAISPDGQYTANNAGIKYLNYVTNNQAYPPPKNDPNHIANFAIQVKPQLGSGLQPFVGIDPPIVRWVNQPETVLKNNFITLQAKIESDGPLYGHYVFHNNERIESTYNPASKIISCTIDAEEGEDNLIYIEAINQGGSVKSSPIQFKFAPVQSRKSYALIFAVENYDNDYTWQQLPNVINGARKLKTELENTYGFEVTLYEDPTFAQIEQALQKIKNQYYDSLDQLLILFTGHGDIQKRGNRDIGFLVASDAKTEGSSRINYFRHSDLEFEADGMDCKHVLVVLDACFSSTFGTSINTAITGANPKGTYLQPQLDDDQQIQKFLSKKSRLYISSGQSETLSGTKYKASPFFEEFLKALQSRKNKEDGMVSFEEIKVDIMRARLTPEPKGGRFGGHEAEGTFLFIQEK